MFICIYDISNSVDNAGAAEPEGARFLDLIASIAWLFLGGNSMACNIGVSPYDSEDLLPP